MSFYRPHPKDGEGNVFSLFTPGGGGVSPAGGGGSGQSSQGGSGQSSWGGGVRSVQPGVVRSVQPGGVRSVQLGGGQSSGGVSHPRGSVILEGVNHPGGVSQDRSINTQMVVQLHNISCMLATCLFTAHIRRMGKVMFSVCSHLGGGSVQPGGFRSVQPGGGQVSPAGGGGSGQSSQGGGQVSPAGGGQVSPAGGGGSVIWGGQSSRGVSHPGGGGQPR